MGQNKMEKDFSNKLNQHEINPTENAWDRLDAMLAVAEEKKSGRNHGWLYIAASIAGFLLIGTIFFSKTQEMIDVKRNDVVLKNQPAIKPSELPVLDSAKEIIPTISKREMVAAIENIKVKNNASHSVKQPLKTDLNNNETQNTPLIANTIITRATGEQAVGNQKTEQQATPAKVDEPLAVAQNSTISNDKSSIKVNAKSLLSQVDGEVNLSFREKMLRTVNKNYHEVAEAVTNRNTK